MEFLSGYAAAKAPYLAYEVEDRFQHSRRSKPTRSNSTSRATTTKRSRIPGHARTNSASTNSSGSGRTEHEPPTLHHNAGWLQSPVGGAGVDISGSGAVTSTAADRAEPIAAQHHSRHRLRRNSARELEWEGERERMSAPLKHYQDKQLPATPRLDTQEASAKFAGAANAAEPASARTPASAGATFGNPGAVVAAVAFPDRRIPQPGAAMYPYPSDGKMSGSGGAKAESLSSVSGATSASNRMSEQRSDSAHHQWPFVVRNGRTYLADPDLPYPLPVDLEELNRQVLKTMMMLQLFGRPICSPEFADRPPSRILDAGCGTGFWSMMCHRYYAARGHKDISFTGLDIVQLPPTLATGSTGSSTSSISGDAPPPDRPDKDMNWRFVQHDLRKVPLPFPDESFDYIMSKDMCLAVSATMNQALIEEYIRVLKPGGTLELWETDHMLRMLRPHVPDDGGTTSGPSIFTTELDSSSFSFSFSSSSSSTTTTTTRDNHHHQQQPQQQHQSEIGGAYVMTANTPLSTPLNTFLVEYNSWITRALETRALNPTPCTAIGALLVQEAETLTNPGSRRLAVPLSEIRWEREGVGGVVTKDGKSYVESASKGTARRAAAAAAAEKGGGGGSSASASGSGGTTGAEGVGGGGGAQGGCSGSGVAAAGSTGRRLDPAAAALRKTALMTVVHRIQSLEPLLREISGKSQDEWDTWLGKMINNLVRENGTSLGECLEVGAWWAKKRIPKP
ncbi:uncharacterized protein B0T15DRAFT_104508 [Chaetomium strumarium]|uniref:Methyltransferase type 11 domain-containing protein n=1 Tax=Chaetomium strumarium TaxID=1170767 RepID=A0AAJ0GY30_9PEZI|nr:hypothetical protein B0T15DRAFT_104508 [Chaetomium strumarium]